MAHIAFKDENDNPTLSTTPPSLLASKRIATRSSRACICISDHTSDGTCISRTGSSNGWHG
ncbi:hypothetical protein [Shewanella denitrificans]|uniref:hypothetical protein n=1 Tax=Shewanella denitrificans TaxID=192073 RepID=UPI0002FD33CD|nr:hypothetical protein [Shewanella denitrificans]